MRRFGLILASAALVIAGCSSSTTAATPANRSTNAAGSTSQGANPTTRPVSGGNHQFTATLTVTGEVKFAVTFTQPLSVLPACSVLAKTGFSNNTWSIPQPNTTDSNLNWNVQPYAGPGTYSDPTTFGDSVDLNGPKGDQYDQENADSFVGSVTVNADGSGSATFKDLADSDGNAVNGTETWTCS
jgi:hypothetical protein